MMRPQQGSAPAFTEPNTYSLQRVPKVHGTPARQSCNPTFPISDLLIPRSPLIPPARRALLLWVIGAFFAIQMTLADLAPDSFATTHSPTESAAGRVRTAC